MRVCYVESVAVERERELLSIAIKAEALAYSSVVGRQSVGLWTCVESCEECGDTVVLLRYCHVKRQSCGDTVRKSKVLM